MIFSYSFLVEIGILTYNLNTCIRILQNHLDEAASAYKNIDEVMANQQDLVKILTRLSPIAVVKG